MNIRVPALSDNSVAESVSNKLFTTTMPLALFLEKLSLLAAQSGITFDVSHIAGKSNVLADAPSRWSGEGDIPGNLLPHDRIFLWIHFGRCSCVRSYFPRMYIFLGGSHHSMLTVSLLDKSLFTWGTPYGANLSTQIFIASIGVKQLGCHQNLVAIRLINKSSKLTKSDI